MIRPREQASGLIVEALLSLVKEMVFGSLSSGDLGRVSGSDHSGPSGLDPSKETSLEKVRA